MKIICLVSPMGAGKDTILKEVIKEYNINPLISYTDRPIRNGETNGVEYNFVTEEEFNKIYFIEKRLYKVANGDNWLYGLSCKEICKCYENFGNYAVILDVQGMRALKEFVNKEFKNDIEVITIMLKASYCTRLNRYLNRDRVTDDMVKEAIRRLYADMSEIEPFINEYDIVLRSEDGDLERNIKIIKSLCE